LVSHVKIIRRSRARRTIARALVYVGEQLCYAIRPYERNGTQATWRDGVKEMNAQLERRTWKARPGVKVLAPAALAVPLCVSAWLFFAHPTAPVLNPLPMIRQGTPYTCGVASLQSILAYYGEEWREDNLARELKSTPEEGTDYHEIVRFAQSKGLSAEVVEGMTVDALKRYTAAGKPVLVAIQAWGDKSDYSNDWDDGHYSIVIGIDERNVYLMDPSTAGNYTFIPIPEFIARWHDSYKNSAGKDTRLMQFGIIFSSSRKPAYSPSALMPLK
jgi:predicted double-glycine peptidase